MLEGQNVMQSEEANYVIVYISRIELVCMDHRFFVVVISIHKKKTLVVQSLQHIFIVAVNVWLIAIPVKSRMWIKIYR
jgi:hypothetical protein